MEAQQRAPSIVGIAAKYGLILGVLWFVVFLVPTLTGIQINQNWVATVLNAAILIVLMVLAHRELKKTRDGMMTYSQGLGSGTLLATAGAVVSCVLVFVYVKYINTGYLAATLKAQRATLEHRGMTGAQVQQATAMMTAIMTPVGVVVTSLISGVLLGFVVALIVSIVTQKSDPRVVT